jgi:hypothetical protein
VLPEPAPPDAVIAASVAVVIRPYTSNVTTGIRVVEPTVFAAIMLARLTVMSPDNAPPPVKAPEANTLRVIGTAPIAVGVMAALVTVVSWPCALNEITGATEADPIGPPATICDARAIVTGASAPPSVMDMPVDAVRLR